MSASLKEEFKISTNVLEATKTQVNNISALKETLDLFMSRDISSMLEALLAGAIVLNASDIHFEPEKEQVKMRLRLDGILYDVWDVPADFFKNISSRIKLLANLKLNIKDKPQDGRFTVSIENGDNIEARCSSIPANYGEALVIRILNEKNIRTLNDLGLRPDLLKSFELEIKKPNGMLLVTGPTGSGKTTTLYAVLKSLANSEIKIITIEDPIEYKLDNITQTQVDHEKEYDFATGLKAIVRQDPDVILVGEIRDEDTCKTAIQASLTGHLVLSTLHTNDAIGSIPRLVALGEQPYNIGPAINMILSQRLVRKVCPDCAKKEKISDEELKIFKNVLQGLPKNVKAEINKDTLLSRPGKCAKCNFTGFRGRTGIYEALFIDDELKDYILNETSVVKLKNKAIEKGMLTLEQDGLLKVLDNQTTLEEVQKVAGFS